MYLFQAHGSAREQLVVLDALHRRGTLTGAVDPLPPLTLQPSEVARVLHVPLAALLDPATRQTGRRTVRGEVQHVPLYRLPGGDVWGATAMMLAELLAVAGEVA